MEKRSIVQGFQLHPEKLEDAEEWASSVMFVPIGKIEDNEYTFDFIGQTIAASDVEEFTRNTLNALAYTQCIKYNNRICYGACFTLNVQPPRESTATSITSHLINENLSCYGEELVIAIIKAKRERPGWLSSDAIKVSSFAYRMSRQEDMFLDECGAKWNASTIGVSVTANITGKENIPQIPLTSPTTTLLAKHVRAVVLCNIGIEESRGLWMSVMTQTSVIGETLCSFLSSLAQHWNISRAQMLVDASMVWEWIYESFDEVDLKVATHVFQSFCCLPFHDGHQETSLITAQRAITSYEFGFDKLKTEMDWKKDLRKFWISLFSTLVSGASDECLAYHRDIMYQYIVEENVVECQDDSMKGLLEDIREGLEEMEEAGFLEPHARSFVEHLAGETIAMDVLEDDIRVNHLALECRMSPTIELSSSSSLLIRNEGKRSRLVIGPDNSLTLQGRDSKRLISQFARSIESVSIFNFGFSRKSSATSDNLQGSMVANLIVQGSFGPEAGLWFLSHVLYGDLKVSTDSSNSLFKAVAKDNNGFKINVDLDAEIAASIHAATDGEQVFLCLSKNLILKLERKGNSIISILVSELDVTEMKGCSLKPYRGIC